MINDADRVAELRNTPTLSYEYAINAKIFLKIKEHGRRVAAIAISIGNKLKMNEKDLERLNAAALYHDYGKYYIPREILLKPSNLTISEMQIMKKHAYYGSEIAISKYIRKDISDYILYHHENYDGTGYYGVKGEFIPLCSRILRIADVYDALTSERPYRNELDKDTAIGIMDSEKNNYDKEIYNVFLDELDNVTRRHRE